MRQLTSRHDVNLPDLLGEMHPRFGSPWRASVTHTVFAVLVVVGFGIASGDPYLDLCVLGSTPAVIGIPVLELLASIAIVAFFGRDRRGHRTVEVIVAPALAAVALAVIVALILTQIELFTARTGLWVHLAFPALLASALVAGIVRGIWLRRRMQQVTEAQPTACPTFSIGISSKSCLQQRIADLIEPFRNCYTCPSADSVR